MMAGTENLPAIIGLAAAMERFIPTPVFDPAHLRPLAERLLTLLHCCQAHGVEFRGARVRRLVNTVSFTVTGVDSMTMLAALDLEGVCASSGSACSAGSLEPSHVMTALGVPAAAANALVRLSLGRESTLAEVEHLERVLPVILERVRR
jgi:cysteine desulfurase